MADSNIGALPLAPNLADDSLLVMEQQGTAMKMTGAQLKDYAKQGVEFEFQGYLDEAKAAADSAEAAVSTVTGMTVEAKTLDSGQPATVAKSVRGGVVNLAFGLPKGAQGEPGPEGKQGIRGPQGAPGTGLTILGHYDTEDALRGAVKAPEVGDVYGVGLEAPYDIYVFDGTTLDWKNYGQLGGGSGGVIPENVVTSEGGASFEYGDGVGEAPHVVTFTYEEEPPLTAEDVSYDGKTVKEAIDGLFTSVSDGKALVASAITDQGVPTAQDAAFAQMAENVRQISTGADTSDATATAWDILTPKTAYTASGKVTGLIPSLPAQTITPGTADKTIANGQYLSGTQIIRGDANLTSANIKKGVSLFGVAGALESIFTATLTVKADIGAVVTATCGDTSVEALSTTGTVVLELPIEGTWKVTAVRGVAQYNTATIVVSSQYDAELTAEVHIEYLTIGAPLSYARYYPAAATAGDYALFAGGLGARNGNAAYSAVDAYNSSLAQSKPDSLPAARGDMGGASVGDYAIFAGGCDVYSGATYSDVTAYNDKLDRVACEELSEARRGIATATIGDYALFAGGGTSSGGSSPSAALESYDASLTHAIHSDLIAYASFVGGANENYAVFCSNELALAYNSKITMSIAPAPPNASVVCARAGNYVVFCGSGDCFAYDAFLTRVSIEPLGVPRSYIAGTTLNDFAVFGGGSTGSHYYSDLSNAVDAYDPYLTHTTPKELSSARSVLGAVSTGDYALFGGGWRNNATTNYSNTVDIYRYV